MKKEDKLALKIIKNGFTIDQWKNFSPNIQKNELIISELIKMMGETHMEKVKCLCEEYPFVLKSLPDQMQLKLITKDNFCCLREDLQMRIIEEDYKKAKYADSNVQINFATVHPERTSYISSENQRMLIKNNVFYLEFASKEIQIEFSKKDVNMLSMCSNLIQCGYLKENPNLYGKCSSEVKRDIVSLANLSPNKITVETIDAYLSCNYDKFSIKELRDYKDKIFETNRSDKKEIINYIDYLLLNLSKKRMKWFLNGSD